MTTLYELICSRCSVADDDLGDLKGAIDYLLKELEINFLVNHLKRSKFPEVSKEHLRRCLVEEYNL